MNLKDLTIEKLIEIRKILVFDYIGTWNKPQSYFDKLKEIDEEIDCRRKELVALLNQIQRLKNAHDNC